MPLSLEVAYSCPSLTSGAMLTEGQNCWPGRVGENHGSKSMDLNDIQTKAMERYIPRAMDAEHEGSPGPSFQPLSLRRLPPHTDPECSSLHGFQSLWQSCRVPLNRTAVFSLLHPSTTTDLLGAD